MDFPHLTPSDGVKGGSCSVRSCQKQRAVSQSVWVPRINSSAGSHFLWPKCSRKMQGVGSSRGILADGALKPVFLPKIAVSFL